MIARTPEQFAHDHAIEARVRHEVMAIDLDRRRGHLRGADPRRRAGGSSGARGEPPRSAVVVGAGYIGLELAEALCARGIPVTVIQRGRTPMDTLDPDMGGMLVEAMRRFTMTLRLEETVTGFETDAGRVRAVVTDQGTVPADLVILGLGVRPNSELAAAAGIPLGPTGAIAVDQRLRTRVAGVWAAGDCVEKFHRVSRRPVTIALGTHANKEGRTAGINLGGGYATFPGVLGTAVTKICDVEVGRTGLGRPKPRPPGSRPSASRSTRPPGPGTTLAPDRSAPNSSPSWAPAGCWAPRSSARRAPPNASTSSPRHCGTRRPSPSC